MKERDLRYGDLLSRPRASYRGALLPPEVKYFRWRSDREPGGGRGAAHSRSQRARAGSRVRRSAESSPGPIPRRPPPTGSKVLPVEEGSRAWGRPWHRAFAIAKGQGRRWPRRAIRDQARASARPRERAAAMRSLLRLAPCFCICLVIISTKVYVIMHKLMERAKSKD